MTTTVTRLAVLFAAVLTLSAIVGCAEEAEGPGYVATDRQHDGRD